MATRISRAACAVFAMGLLAVTFTASAHGGTIAVQFGKEQPLKVATTRGVVLGRTVEPAGGPAGSRRRVVGWTERVVRRGRAEQRTFVAWCDPSGCGRPVRVATQRTRDKGSWVTLAAVGDRAFLKFGPDERRRWAFVARKGGRIAGGTASVWDAPNYPWSDVVAYARTGDGRDWIGWQTTAGRLFVAHPQSGRLRGRQIEWRGAGLQFAANGNTLVATWARTNDTAGYYKPVMATATSTTQLADHSRHNLLSNNGRPPMLLNGYDDVPPAMIWRTGAGIPDLTGVISTGQQNIAWLQPDGARPPDPGHSLAPELPDDSLIDDRPTPLTLTQGADGALTICPFALVATRPGAAFAAAPPEACAAEATRLLIR